MKLAFFNAIAIMGSVTVSTAVSAQVYTGQQRGILTAPVARTVYDGGVFSAGRDGPVGTPEMKRQRLAIMTALHTEMTQLRAADGGTLSDGNRAYLTRKANRLLAR